MRLLIISSDAERKPGAEFNYRKYLTSIRKDGIRCLTTRVVTPLSANRETRRSIRILKRWFLQALKRILEGRLLIYSRFLRKGDALFLLSIAALEKDAFVIEMIRSRDFRVLLWLGDAAAVKKALQNNLARMCVNTILVPDETTRRLAAQGFSDVRMLSNLSDNEAETAGNYAELRRALYPTVRIYGLFYKFIDIFEETIQSLIANTDINVRIFVAENYSEESEHNREIIKSYVDKGVIEGYALFQENIYGSAFEYLYKDIFPAGPEDEIVIFSDLDMTIPADARNWLRLMIDKFITFDQMAVLSLDFDLSNWNPKIASGHLPPEGKHWSRKYGIYTMPSGVWFLSVRKRIIDEYLYGTNVFGDKLIFQYIHSRFRKKIYGRLPIYCRHLSWDLETKSSSYIKSKYETFYNSVYQRYDCPSYELYVSTSAYLSSDLQKVSSGG